MKTINQNASEYAKTNGLPMEKFMGLTIVKNDGMDQPSLYVWEGSKKKPSFKKSFVSIKARDEYLDTVKFIHKREMAEKKAGKELRKSQKIQYADKIDVGTILYSSWGYEQTNVSFYQVIEKHGMKVMIREIQAQIKGSGAMNGTATAAVGQFKGNCMTRMVGPGYVKISSSELAHVWSGEEMDCSWYA